MDEFAVGRKQTSDISYLNIISQRRSLGKSTLPKDRISQRPKMLLHRVRDAVRLKHYVNSAEKTYVYWAKRFVVYQENRHPLEMAEKEISEFLTYLAAEEDLAARAQIRPSARRPVSADSWSFGPEPATIAAANQVVRGQAGLSAND